MPLIIIAYNCLGLMGIGISGFTLDGAAGVQLYHQRVHKESVMTERLRARIQALVFDQKGVGSDPGRDTCHIKLGR